MVKVLEEIFVGKYHSCAVEVPGQMPRVNCRSHGQALKYVHEPLIEVKLDSENKTIFALRRDQFGQPLVATITHEIVEIEDETEAAARGLRKVFAGDAKAYQKKYVLVKAQKPVPPVPPHLWACGYLVTEFSEEIAAEFAELAATEAAELEARAARLRSNISTKQMSGNISFKKN